MTSTIGASFTSVSFLQTLVKPVGRHLALSTSTFITIATVAFLVLGTTPKSLLVFAGAFNGLILPQASAGAVGGECRRLGRRPLRRPVRHRRPHGDAVGGVRSTSGDCGC